MDNGYGLFDRAGKTLVFAKCRKAIIMLRFLLRYNKVARFWRVIGRYHGRVRRARGLRAIKGDWERSRALGRVVVLLEARAMRWKGQAIGTIAQWSRMDKMARVVQKWVRRNRTVQGMLSKVR